jgi:hypothetical protein
MTDQSEEQKPESRNSVINVSGGVNANAEQINVGADVVGRDKTISAGTYIEHYYAGSEPAVTSHFESSAPTFTEESPKPLPNKRVPDKRIIIGVLLVGAILVAVVALILIFRPVPLILTNSNWKIYQEAEAASSISLQSLPESNTAISITLALKQGDSVGVYQKLKLKSLNSIRFSFRGSGLPYTLELKLIDENGTIFKSVWQNITNTNEQSIMKEVPLNQLKCDKGTGRCEDENAVNSLSLNPAELNRIDFSFLNEFGHTEKSDSGSIVIDEIQIFP